MIKDSRIVRGGWVSHVGKVWLLFQIWCIKNTENFFKQIWDMYRDNIFNMISSIKYLLWWSLSKVMLILVKWTYLAELNILFCIPTPPPDPGKNRKWTHLEQKMNTLNTKTNTPKTRSNTLKTQIEHTLKTLEYPSILWFLESSLSDNRMNN